MALSREEVEHIAELARLALSDDEVALYQEQLSAILDYMQQLQRLDTATIEPTATVLPLRSVMRDDAPCPPSDHEDILANAPEPRDRCYGVPPVLD